MDNEPRFFKGPSTSVIRDGVQTKNTHTTHTHKKQNKKETCFFFWCVFLCLFSCVFLFIFFCTFFCVLCVCFFLCVFFCVCLCVFCYLFLFFCVCFFFLFVRVFLCVFFFFIYIFLEGSGTVRSSYMNHGSDHRRK